MPAQSGKHWFPRRKARSFRSRLLLSFFILSILPVLALSFSLYQHIVNAAQKSIDKLISNNLEMISRNLNVTLSAYSDILFQLYTSDELVSLVQNIAEGDDVALNRNQLLRTLRAACYYKPYIQGVTVLLENGDTVFYDKLTGSATHNAWLSSYPFDSDEILALVDADNQMHLLPTAFAAYNNNESEYLFHMAHRIIDYHDIYAQQGIVILSIDSDMLMEIIGYDTSDSKGENLLLNTSGDVMASAQGELIGTKMPDPLEASFALAKSTMKGNPHVYSAVNDEYGLQIIRVLDQSAIREDILAQQSWFFIGLLLASAALLAAVIMSTSRMTSSIRSVVSAMGNAGQGDMRTRLSLPANAPSEITVIANDFNRMMSELEWMMREVRLANDRKRQAELTAVEAQLNPHFLYNTLDTINWMSIDREQYEISNCISALGAILRYAIDRSNKLVTVREELAWMDRYVYLQQTRLKNGFAYHADVQEECLRCRVHKLLFQPFVENAVLHGFENGGDVCRLNLTIAAEGNELVITIADNGKGMTTEKTRAAFSDLDETAGTQEDRTHIGIRNAMARMKMYYGDQAQISVVSVPGEGTTITLRIPMDNGGVDTACESSS